MKIEFPVHSQTAQRECTCGRLTDWLIGNTTHFDWTVYQCYWLVSNDCMARGKRNEGMKMKRGMKLGWCTPWWGPATQWKETLQHCIMATIDKTSIWKHWHATPHSNRLCSTTTAFQCCVEYVLLRRLYTPLLLFSSSFLFFSFLFACFACFSLYSSFDISEVYLHTWQLSHLCSLASVTIHNCHVTLACQPLYRWKEVEIEDKGEWATSHILRTIIHYCTTLHNALLTLPYCMHCTKLHPHTHTFLLSL